MLTSFSGTTAKELSPIGLHTGLQVLQLSCVVFSWFEASFCLRHCRELENNFSGLSQGSSATRLLQFADRPIQDAEHLVTM